MGIVGRWRVRLGILGLDIRHFPDRHVRVVWRWGVRFGILGLDIRHFPDRHVRVVWRRGVRSGILGLYVIIRLWVFPDWHVRVDVLRWYVLARVVY